jgi:Na+-driven multidrug efflux pump
VFENWIGVLVIWVVSFIVSCIVVSERYGRRPPAKNERHMRQALWFIILMAPIFLVALILVHSFEKVAGEI